MLGLTAYPPKRSSALTEKPGPLPSLASVVPLIAAEAPLLKTNGREGVPRDLDCGADLSFDPIGKSQKRLADFVS